MHLTENCFCIRLIISCPDKSFLMTGVPWQCVHRTVHLQVRSVSPRRVHASSARQARELIWQITPHHATVVCLVDYCLTQCVPTRLWAPDSQGQRLLLPPSHTPHYPAEDLGPTTQPPRVPQHIEVLKGLPSFLLTWRHDAPFWENLN